MPRVKYKTDLSPKAPGIAMMADVDRMSIGLVHSDGFHAQCAPNSGPSHHGGERTHEGR